MASTLDMPVETGVARSGRLYFLHIPKTAGITVGRFLRNHYPNSDTLIIDEWKARALPPQDVRRHSLFSGHYASEVLDAMGPRPFTVTLIREPLSRFDSWSVHCRRVSHRKYRDMFEGKTDLDVITGPDGYTCRQAHWLARALRTGADDTTVPASHELPGLLDDVDIVGVTDEVERFMQLVSFRMGWPPPPRGWHVNRRPTASSDAEPLPDAPKPPTRRATRTTEEETTIRRELNIDTELYDLATQRFWLAYAAMLGELCPDNIAFTPESAAAVSIDDVQDWLRARYADVVANTFPHAVTDIDVTADDAICGEGWWWRSGWDTLDDRWTGPEPRSTWYLPPLAANRAYELTIEVLWPASPAIWENTTVEVNGQRVFVSRERCTPAVARGASHLLRATIPARVVASQDRSTRVVLEIPETVQALKKFVVCESFDTYHHDERFVGLSVQALRVRAV